MDLTSLARRPAGLGWAFLGRMPGGLLAWRHEATSAQVVSAVEIADQPRSGTPGPQWHISVVDRSAPDPQRPSPEQIALARCAFDMLDAEEDNHHPGRAWHFWLPVDPTERVECECKTEEVMVEDADGYRWSNAKDGECRGCEHEAQMRALGLTRPCPLHNAHARQLRAGAR